MTSIAGPITVRVERGVGREAFALYVIISGRMFKMQTYENVCFLAIDQCLLLIFGFAFVAAAAAPVACC